MYVVLRHLLKHICDILGFLFVMEVGLRDSEFPSNPNVFMVLWFKFCLKSYKTFLFSMKDIGTLDRNYIEFQQNLIILFIFYDQIQKLVVRRRHPQLKIRMSQRCGHHLGNFEHCCAMIFRTFGLRCTQKSWGKMVVFFFYWIFKLYWNQSWKKIKQQIVQNLLLHLR